MRVHSLNALHSVFRFCKSLITSHSFALSGGGCARNASRCSVWASVRSGRRRGKTRGSLALSPLPAVASAFASSILLCSACAGATPKPGGRARALPSARHLCFSTDVELQDGVALLQDSDHRSPWRSRMLCTKRKNSDPASDSSLGSLSHIRVTCRRLYGRFTFICYCWVQRQLSKGCVCSSVLCLSP